MFRVWLLIIVVLGLSFGGAPDAAAQYSDSLDAPAIMWAARAGDVDGARRLVADGHDPRLKGVIWLDQHGSGSYYGSALAAAAAEGWTDMVAYLIDEVGVPVDDREWNPADSTESGWTGLQWAVGADQADVVRLLAARGADLDVRNRDGEPLVLTFADAGRLPVIRTLLEAGADVNATDADGNSPLMYAMVGDAVELVDLMLDYGADPNKVGSDGATPVLYAMANYATTALMHVLSEPGRVDVHQTDEYGVGPIHWAAMGGVPEIVSRLLDLGADPNARDSLGSVPLVYAAQNGRTGAADVLLEYGADPNLAEWGGWRPLHYATQRSMNAIMRSLIAAGADVDARSQDGLRALEIAIDSLIVPTVETLLCAGASLQEPDAEGRTPLQRARDRETADLEADAAEWGLTDEEKREADSTYRWISSLLEAPEDACGVLFRVGTVDNQYIFMAIGGVVAARQINDAFLGQEKARLGEEQEGYAYLLAHSLWVDVESGDTRRGLQRAARALEIHEAIYPPGAADLARVYAPLAALLAESDADQSRHYAELAIELTAGNDEESVDYEWLRPRALLIRAFLELRGGQDGDASAGARAALEAVDDIDEAIRLLETREEEMSASTYRWRMSDAHHLRAEALEMMGEVEDARSAFMDAIDFATLRGNYVFGGSLLADYALFVRRHEPDNRDEAAQFAEAATQVVTKYLSMNWAGMSVAELSAFVTDKLTPIVDLLLSSAADGADIRPAYEKIHALKGVLMRALREQSVTMSSEDDFEFDMYGRLWELRKLRREIAAESVSPSGSPASRDSLTVRKEQLERQVLRDRTRIRDTVSDSTLTDFQLLLEDNEVLLDVYRYQDLDGPQYGVAMVTRDTTSVKWVRLGSAERIESAIAAWRAEVTRGGFGGEELRALHALLVAPLRLDGVAPGVTRVWVSPDAALARVPWSLVLNPGAGEDAAAETGVAYVDAVHVDSPREVARLRMTSRNDLGRRSEAELLLIGDVDFDDAGPTPGPGETAAAGQMETGVAFGPLPGTRAEVDRLYEMARRIDRPALRITGRDVTRAVLTDRLSNARYAHVATHGFFFRDNTSVEADTRGVKKLGVGGGSGAITRNPLVESGLALAGANRGADGLFTAEDMIGLGLGGMELLVLSACDTGRGAEVTGQGVMGLQAALAAAGVRTLLMSLWKVPDESTALLMEHFYQNLFERRMHPAAALRGAQEAVQRNPLYTEPVHWAAWVLVGEGWR